VQLSNDLIDLGAAAAATEIEKAKVEDLAAALASILVQPRLNPYTVFCDVWQPSLAALSDEDLETAWRLADYWMLDGVCTAALAQEAVQRACRYMEDVELTESTALQQPPCLSSEHWAAAGAVRAAQERAFALAVDLYGTQPLDIVRSPTWTWQPQTNHSNPAQVPRELDAEEMVCIATLWGHRAWEVGVRDPRESPASAIAEVIEAAGGAVCARAAAGGHTQLLQLLRDNGFPRTAAAAQEVARIGNLEMLQWLWNNGWPMDETSCAAAARRGHLEILQWLRREAGCEWDRVTCFHAVLARRLDILQWAVTQGCPWRPNFCLDLAARMGDIDIVKVGSVHPCAQRQVPPSYVCLQWLISQGYLVGADTCAAAASAGRLDMVVWLVQECGCPYDSRACSRAAGNGHLNVLQWLRVTGGCPWDEATCIAAYNGGRVAVLEWAIEQGCPCPAHIHALNQAGRLAGAVQRVLSSSFAYVSSWLDPT
jgi:hypothetical protein